MAKTFRKRSGTTNRGTDYELLNIANISMDLVTDEKVQDCHISSNDEAFGDFDDIVAEIQLEHTTEIYALQLKHSDRATLSLKQLCQPSGDFSIRKYFSSVAKIQVKAKFILFTNLKFHPKKGTVFYLTDADFPVTITKVCPKDVKISQKNDYCYKFSVAEDSCSYEYRPEVLLYKRFFENFFLYSNQEKRDNLKRNVTEKFKTLFGGNEAALDQYCKVINQWSLEGGTKPKLDKKWMRLAIALKVLSPHIRPLSFDSCTVDVKRKILREAIMVFDVSVFARESYGDVKALWSDLKSELRDLQTLNKLRTNYQLSGAYISDVAKVDDSILSILLWLMGKCPLILAQDTSVLELCSGEKFILLDPGTIPEKVGTFRTLSDLKNKAVPYKQLVESFTCSLQGKEEILLENLIRDKDEILPILKTDDLLEMCEGKCRIGEAKESLPDTYIERFLLKSAIDLKILDEIPEDTVVILDCVKDWQDILKRPNFRLYEGRCETSEFRSVCADTKNVHHFRVRDDGHLEWIGTKGDLSSVAKYQLLEYYPVHERNLSSFEFQSGIHLLASDPGMGKSASMRSFKRRCFPERLTIIVDPKDVYSFVKNQFKTLQRFLLDEKYKTLSDRDRAIFGIFLQTNETVFVWDALDELSDEHREVVTEIIVEQSCVQWVTTRCHLQKTLQEKFGVLSLNLNKFAEDQQRSYIRERLSPAGDSEDIIANIQSSFVLVDHKDILGIPLQIFMLTELLRQDRKRYSALLEDFFLLTDLFWYFIQEKLNIYFKEKLGIELKTALLEKFVQKEYTRILDEYTNAALRLLFPDSILSELGVGGDFQIYDNRTNIGLVTEGNQFIHSSFAEFLAARFFANNPKHREVVVRVIFDPRFTNVRFFFDLLLAGDSRAHVALLYKNFGFVVANSGEIAPKMDAGGRSVLHLACSWGHRYPRLEVRGFVIDHFGIFDIFSESDGYLRTLDRLLEKCDSSRCDEIFKMAPGDYARKATCLVAEMRIVMNGNTGNLQDEDAINMLYYSASYGYHDEFVFFFEFLASRHNSRGLVANIKNSYGLTILFIATHMGHARIVQFLLDRGADPNPTSDCSPIIFAILKGFHEIVDILIKAGADVNSPTDSFGDPPLYIACSKGDSPRVVATLINAGADVNGVNRSGCSPLYAASQSGHDEIVKLLIDHGADPNLANTSGTAPLHVACQHVHGRTVALLVQAGADVNLADGGGEAPLETASRTGDVGIVETLIGAGADVHRGAATGFTVLHKATLHGCRGVVEALVRHGADFNLAQKVTPLCFASLLGRDEVVKFFIGVGADVNSGERDGFPPIYRACEGGHKGVVELLLEAGADGNLTAEGGLTPREIASKNGYDEIVELLVSAESSKRGENVKIKN